MLLSSRAAEAEVLSANGIKCATVNRRQAFECVAQLLNQCEWQWRTFIFTIHIDYGCRNKNSFTQSPN